MSSSICSMTAAPCLGSRPAQFRKLPVVHAAGGGMAMRLGTRGSPLALTQCRMVAALLARATGKDADDFPLEAFVTSGDRLKDQRLQDAGGKGLFTRELDEALLDGRIDAAVHSMKDLPTHLPDGIVLAAVPEREDPRDAFISHKARTLRELPRGAVVGTASL